MKIQIQAMTLARGLCMVTLIKTNIIPSNMREGMQLNYCIMWEVDFTSPIPKITSIQICDIIHCNAYFPFDWVLFTSIHHAISHSHLVKQKNVRGKISEGTQIHNNTKLPYFYKSSAMISNLGNKTWFSHYPHCQYIIYDNRREFKLHFEALCESYGIKNRLTSVKNPRANAMLYWSGCIKLLQWCSTLQN